MNESLKNLLIASEQMCGCGGKGKNARVLIVPRPKVHMPWGNGELRSKVMARSTSANIDYSELADADYVLTSDGRLLKSRMTTNGYEEQLHARIRVLEGALANLQGKRP